MKHFLHRVAETYFQHHTHEINRFTFVFPNRRAGLFFQQYLADVATRPFFSPSIITIEQWFEQASGMSLADKLYQLFRLYELFRKISGSEETFDTFTFWGEIILNDFNEVDKYRVDAQQLFQNISDLKSIDENFAYLSTGQIEAIRSFWKNFNPMPDKQSQHEFLETWKVLHSLYQDFRQLLSDEKLAYEGMMMREVTDKLLANQSVEWVESKKFVFIGFNALNPCEKGMMLALQKLGQADFYWDYDAETVQDPDNPASRFFKENTLLFPSRYPITRETRPLSEKKIQLINVPSGVGQAKEVYSILQQLYPETAREESFLQTAIVLPDEQLLLPMLYSIPEHIRKINVTMGYPMSLTPVAGLMDHLFELHRKKRKRGDTNHFYHQNVTNILNHQFIAEVEPVKTQELIIKITSENLIYIDQATLSTSELLAALFKADVDAVNFTEYLKEILFLLYKAWKSKHEDASNSLEAGFLYQYFSAVNRLQQLLSTYTFVVTVTLDTLMRIIRELTATITVPFVGEPLDGLQIMGVLETRGLDFKNILLCSFNEGIYPKKSFSNSFIPYQLRHGFELPTFEQLDAVTAYNFYRLIHHAETIYFLTDSRSEGGSTGEVSRFFYQLKYYYGLDMQVSSPAVNVSFETPQSLVVTKDKRLQNQLRGYFTGERALSASGINTYIRCPLAFYLSVLEQVDTPDEITETVENDTFGNLFHYVMAELYAPYTERTITAEVIDGMLADVTKIDRLLSQAFAYYFFKKPKGTAVELEGNNLLIAKVIRKYVAGVLKQDRHYVPFTYIAGEKSVKATLATRFGEVHLKGFIDRIDSKADILRILDYKTGGGGLEFNSWDSMFDRTLLSKDRPKHVLQTLLYGYLYKAESCHNEINPGLFYTRKVFDEQFSTELSYKNEQKESNPIRNYYEIESEFIPRLIHCVEELMDPEIPFFQTEVKEACIYCDFKTICKRQ